MDDKVRCWTVTERIPPLGFFCIVDLGKSLQLDL